MQRLLDPTVCSASPNSRTSVLDDDLKRIAARIRSWRDDAGFTLQQLGDRSGVSASTIHKIENLQTVPTIAVLLKVASGLARRPSELLADVDASDHVAVLKHCDRPNFHIKGRAKLEHLVGMIPRNRIDLWRASLEPGDGAGVDGEPWQFDGEVVLLCEDGALDCEIAGRDFRLAAGDSIHFDATQPHRWLAAEGSPATVAIFALLPERMHDDLMTRIASAAANGPDDSEPVSTLEERVGREKNLDPGCPPEAIVALGQGASSAPPDSASRRALRMPSPYLRALASPMPWARVRSSSRWGWSRASSRSDRSLATT